MTSTLVRVNLGPRSYDIDIDSGNLDRMGEFVTRNRKVTHAVIVADRTVAGFYGVKAVDALHSAGLRVDLIQIDPGEELKCVATLDMLWNTFAQLRVDRKTVIVALGGGVMGDVAGFAAASFARGLRFFQIPTTLLSQVDSSVGGKVGVNLPSGKNLVGAFWQPEGVLIDTDLLRSLPEREFVSGLAEVVKYGVILDAEFFAYLEKNVESIKQRDSAVLRHIIARSCRLKADVVEQDEREETGLRAILNYGHTFGHALEAVASYGTYLHGEAVSIGMMCAARLALRLKLIEPEFVARQQHLLEQLSLPVSLKQVDGGAMLQAMSQDKKTEFGKLKFILPERMGSVKLVEGVDSQFILDSIR